MAVATGRMMAVAAVVGVCGMAGAGWGGVRAARGAAPGVAVMYVDTDRPVGEVDERIYGQFLEHINHSVVDGLYAEQVRGQGFEGKDFADYWEVMTQPGAAGPQGMVEVVDVKFEGSAGEKSVRLKPDGGMAGIRQKRIYLEAGKKYDGSVWVYVARTVGAAWTGKLELRVKDSGGKEVARVALGVKADFVGLQEVPFGFESGVTDREGAIELVATGAPEGASVLVDFLSMMRADVRANGKLRPDLLEALKGLKPAFIRWPGGSYASEYLWKDGVGPAVKRVYHPNMIWGGYSDYYGFGTEEFMELCRQLGSEPLVVLKATGMDAGEMQYAMEWVHYMLDPATTEWGKKRAANGHAEPYKVPYIQIDNEPMNHNFTAEQYAAIVNMYGAELRKIAPQVKIVACGQKRSNDMEWSQKMIDIAGENFDILGCHNYEYEPESYITGVRRIEDYLEKASAYIRTSGHPNIKLAVLEWSLARTYDWRSGLHTAGSLMSYEKLSPTLAMTCPALLMRNTTDNPEWRAWIYHDHVSWFAGGGYVAEKLFREHFAPKQYAFTSGTFKDIPRRAEFFNGISQMKPEGWTPGTVDAIATGNGDGKRYVIKAVNYVGDANTLLVRLAGSKAPEKAAVTMYSVTAGLNEENTLAEPGRIKVVERAVPYAKDMAIELPGYTVAVVEVRGE